MKKNKDCYYIIKIYENNYIENFWLMSHLNFLKFYTYIIFVHTIFYYIIVITLRINSNFI